MFNMKYAIVTLYDEPYAALAEYTWKQNKVVYAEKHGYLHTAKTDNFYGSNPGFDKIWFLNDMLEQNQNLEWIWWTGCDTLITNMTIKIEDRIDDNYHLIAAGDCNADINADSFIIRNSPFGREYIKKIMSFEPEYRNHGWRENQVMINLYHEHKDKIKILPQRELNAYECSIHPSQPTTDKLGNDGDWKYGDLLIHWPATSLGMRIDLAKKYMEKVIY